MSFAHLHNYTQYSLSNGLCGVEELFSKAEELGIRGLAITDKGTMAGVPVFLEEGRKHPSVKPIIGCEIRLNDKIRAEEGLSSLPLVLLAKNEIGYYNLVKLVSRPYVTHSLLAKYHKGLICLSSGPDGLITQALRYGNVDYAQKVARWYKKTFGHDFYLEAVNLNKEQSRCCDELFKLAMKLHIKVVATNVVLYVNKGDAPVLDKLASLGKPEDIINHKKCSRQAYLKSEKQMRNLFPEHPEVIDNTMEIVRKIRNFDIFQSLDLPVFPIPEKLKSDANSYLCHLAFCGARKRYGQVLPQKIESRLNDELATISRMGYADYLLIVQDYVNWARKNNIYVGPGRGNAPGSLVVYCLGITEIDPMRYGLLFERFLNPLYPYPSSLNIDVDLDEDGRSKVLGYLIDKYGNENVALTWAYGIMKTKHPGYDVQLDNIICRKAINACSVILSRHPLDGYLPIDTCIFKSDGREYHISQYASNYAEKTGVLQLDLIGFDLLSQINNCLSLVEKKYGVKVELDKIPIDDAETFALFCNGDTDGVFHCNDTEKQKYLRELQPDCLEDLMAMEALYRSCSIQFIPELIARKHNKEQIPDALPLVRDVLAETYGLTVYQEQIMKIAQLMAEISSDYTDALRRALFRQDSKSLDNIYSLFVSGCSKKGIHSDEYKPIWNEWVSLCNTVFSKSHAAAYAWLSYQTAWLKVHYPEEYNKSFFD